MPVFHVFEVYSTQNSISSWSKAKDGQMALIFTLQALNHGTVLGVPRVYHFGTCGGQVSIVNFDIDKSLVNKQTWKNKKI